MPAAKFIYKLISEHDLSSRYSLSVTHLVNENDLWIADEWTHIGCCIVTCLENIKLVETYKKGNSKIIDSLIGKTIKNSNMTVDANLVRDLMPLIINRYF